MLLRDQKAALTRLKMLNVTLELVGKKSFNDLSLVKLSDRALVSKVTASKYFPEKEDLLRYYLQIWFFRRNVELYIKPRVGVDGLEFLFAKLYESYLIHPGLMAASIWDRYDPGRRNHKEIDLKAADKFFVFDTDEYTHIEAHSLEKMIESFVLQIPELKQMPAGARKNAGQLVLTVLIGTLLINSSVKGIDLEKTFKQNLTHVLNGLKATKVK